MTHDQLAVTSPEKQDTTDIAVLPSRASICRVQTVGYKGECHPSSAGAVTELQRDHGLQREQ